MIKELEAVFREVFNNEKLVLTPETTNNDINGWTSLTHAILINSIERKFNVTFDIQEMLSMQTVTDIINRVSEKVK